MIDFTLPVETTENPPRPVRVLATDGPNFNRPIAIWIGNAENPTSCTRDGRLQDWDDAEVFIRNVAPKPVRLEGWLNLYPDLHTPPALWKTKEGADGAGFAHRRVECRHIVWNSDGSPVEGDAPVCGYKDHAHLERDRDRWKAKAEALQAEVDRLSEVEREWRKVHHAEVKRLEETVLLRDGKVRWHQMQVDGLREELARCKPVVDAAVAWFENNDYPPHISARLEDAVRAYQNAQPATSEMTERELELQKRWNDIAEPVKNCPTCCGSRILVPGYICPDLSVIQPTPCPDCGGTGEKK